MTETDVQRGEGVGTQVDRDVLAYELLSDTTKARVYTAVLAAGPIRREEVTERIEGVSGTTVYQTLTELAETAYVTVDDATEPYTYTARPIRTQVLGDDGRRVFEVTPTFVAVVSARATRDDVALFLDRHTVGTLAAAYEATLAYLNGEVSRRMAAERAGLDPYEGITITEEIESVVRAMRGVDPYLTLDEGADE